jgi:cytochrome c oxidase cbb3-type subunit 3
VRNGHPAKGMPAIAMTAVQMKDLVAYIQWVVQKYDRVSPGPPPDDYPVERLLTGNADAGKAFFNGAGGCNGCHSVTGDLAGVAKKYPPVFLQSRFLMPRATKPRLATVTLASGEKVIGELKTINTYDVVIQEAGGKALTFVADDVKVEVRDPLAPHRALLPKYTDADVHNMFAYLWSLQ